MSIRTNVNIVFVTLYLIIMTGLALLVKVLPAGHPYLWIPILGFFLVTALVTVLWPMLMNEVDKYEQKEEYARIIRKAAGPRNG